MLWAIQLTGGLMNTATELGVVVIDHALAKHHISVVRSNTSQRAEFRASIAHLTTMVLLEATRDLALTGCQIRTPMGTTRGDFVANAILVAPILRAGMPMVDPILEFFPSAVVGCIGTKRNEETAEPMSYHCSLPERIAANTVVLMTDVMLATGGSMVDAIQRVKDRGGVNIRALCIITAPEGIQRVNEAHPDVKIFATQRDERLNEKNYIVPGLGDAGDRWFGNV